MVPVPNAEAQEDITAKLDALAAALQSHPSWTPSQPHPGLFYVWDFVKRSHYIMTELDNIRNGRELKHPDQIPPHEDAKDNEEKTQMSFTDVVTRSITVNKIVHTPAMMAMFGQGPVDFGDDVKSKSTAVQDAIYALPE